jgi:hypothetical protein
MTSNHSSSRSYSPARSTITTTSFNEDHFANLPDLSGLKENEKQHILNVLLRDEKLRDKHLSRFGYVFIYELYQYQIFFQLFRQLRKEVAELEQQPQAPSASVCALCKTPFGVIFNTGATCPKCDAKVCKQCRLMYNVHDNGWLCQLCCKQM